jgi:Kef-type K+ transport system membrane component KefB
MTEAAKPPSARSPGLVRPVLMLLALLALVAAARSFTRGTGDVQATSSGAAMGFGLALLGAVFMGQLFAALKLPRLTGYLFLGVVAGPQGFDLITDRMLADLKLVNGVAIALIALTAGLELNMKKMRPRLASIAAMGGLGIGTAIVVVSVASFALSSLLPQFEADFTVQQRIAVALLTGTVFATVSPSVAFAILAETGSEGPVSETALGLVVLGDIALVIGFAAVNAFVASKFSAGGAHGGVGTLFFEIFGSLAVGVGLGFILSVYVKRVARKTPLFAFGLCFLAAEAGGRLHLDPLLLCLSAGLTVENLTAVEGTKLAHDLEIAALPTFAVFFCVAGAGLHVREFGHVAQWAVLFALLRGCSLLAGAKVGAFLSRPPEMVRKYGPFAMLPQAGVAIGLAILVKKQFGGTIDHPRWGDHLADVVLGTIALNEFIGPSILRWAMTKTGEAGKKAAVEGGH